MRPYLLFILAIMTLSCQKKENLEDFFWMEGLWLKDDPDTLLYSSETWKILSEFEMQGFGLTMEAGDTIFYEQLSIVSKKDGIYYIADVGNGPVSFKLSTIENDKWIFKNPEHDFPQRIIYTRTDTTMVAFAEAADVSIPFRFKRANK